MPVDATLSITKQDLNPFHSTQFLFITTFNALLSNIISRHIITVRRYILLRHLGYITKQMCCIRIGVTTNRAFSYIKPLKTEKFLLEYRKVLTGQLTQEYLLHIGGIARIFSAIFDIIHSHNKFIF